LPSYWSKDLEMVKLYHYRLINYVWIVGSTTPTNHYIGGIKALSTNWLIVFFCFLCVHLNSF